MPPRTHDLDTLLTLLLPSDGSLATLRRQLESLTRYAVSVRYPDERATKKQAHAALRHAERLRKELRARLGLTSA
jgi:HEPN domain-containing protein